MNMYKTLEKNIRRNKITSLATIIDGENVGKKLLIYSDGTFKGDLGDLNLNQRVIELSKSVFEMQEPRRESIEIEGKLFDVFVDIFQPMPKMIIIGAVHIAIPLVTLGNIAGFYTIVIDPRRAFAMEEKFTHADELIIEWPTDVLEKVGVDEASCFITLTHDEKIDNPSLAYALKSPARYIGALGSKRTHAKRKTALMEMGFKEDDFNRIHGPIGLKIGGRGPEEIAISIIAEIVAEKHGIKLSKV